MCHICNGVTGNMSDKKKENRLRHNGLDELDVESLLAQWQTYVEMANSVSSRRDTKNNLFVTLHLALVTTVAVIWDSKAYPLLGLGCVLCLIWLLSIGNYRKLNQAKYDVICEIEKQLPAQPFNDEWINIKNKRFYIESTHLEKCMPLLFFVSYIVIFVLILI
jgi:hypothetical protein